MAKAEPAAIRYFGLRAKAYRIAGIAAGPTSVNPNGGGLILPPESPTTHDDCWKNPPAKYEDDVVPH